jgi:hypothetical protein
MRTRYLLLPLGLSLLALTLATARADGPDWFDFVIPWDDAAPGATDVSALNPTPAGGRGFVTAKDGHFYDEKGNRVRFFGVNICYSGCFPDKADAEKVAAHLHKFGVNIVRLHAMDSRYAPEGLFDPRFKDRQHLDAGQLDRLDYFIAQLKRNGIYVNINLHVGRSLTAHDGIADAHLLPAAGAIVNYFEPRTIALHKDYARDLLTHFNPYTKTRYVEEPAVACVELSNENTLTGVAWRDTLDRLPASFRGELARQWNAWLKKRYGTTDALRRAWQGGAVPGAADLVRNGGFTSGTDGWRLERHEGAVATAEVPAGLKGPDGAPGKVLRLKVDRAGTQGWHVQFHQAGLDLSEGEPYTVTFWARADQKRTLPVGANLDQDDYRNIGLAEPVQLTTEWKQFRLTFRPRRTVAGHARLGFALGAASGTVDLAGISIRAGGGDAPANIGSLENGTVPLGKAALKSPAGHDWVAFLIDTERAYVDTMRDYLRKELKARANVTCSQASYGGLGGAMRERRSDFVDMHAYWQHPVFPGRDWDPGNWRIRNTPMTRDTNGGALAGMARHRLADMPFTVSEYNHPAPNDYQAECLPMLAAFAALQDWDAVYLFDYHSDRATWNSDKIRGYFSIASNPAKMAFLPAAATLFLRGDVQPPADECRVCIPEDGISEFMVQTGRDFGAAWFSGDRAPAQEYLTRRLSVAFVPGKGAITVKRTGDGKGSATPVRWQGGTDQALFTADSPRSKVMVGFLGGRKVELPGWQVEMAKTANSFAALTLTAMDGQPINQSRSLLLTAVGKVENKGMQWNAERTSVGRNWGTGPTRAEGIPAAVTIATRARSAAVYALDSAGRRQRRLDATLAGGRLTFTIGPAARTLWYEVEVDSQPPAGN